MCTGMSCFGRVQRLVFCWLSCFAFVFFLFCLFFPSPLRRVLETFADGNVSGNAAFLLLLFYFWGVLL